MPIKVSVKHDFQRAEAALSDLALRQLPFATAAALTDTAMQAREKITAALPTIFDRPVPFTLNAVAFKPATKANLTATVFVKDTQAKYLLHEEIGGTRTTADNSRVPGAAFSEPSKITLDASGNIPNGAIKALAELAKQKTGTVLDKKALRRNKMLASKVGQKGKVDISIAYLKGAGPGGRGPGGFFERLPDDKITRLTSFAKEANYKPIFRFAERVTLVARQSFHINLTRRLREALSEKR